MVDHHDFHGGSSFSSSQWSQMRAKRACASPSLQNDAIGLPGQGSQKNLSQIERRRIWAFELDSTTRSFRYHWYHLNILKKNMVHLWACPKMVVACFSSSTCYGWLMTEYCDHGEDWGIWGPSFSDTQKILNLPLTSKSLRSWLWIS